MSAARIFAKTATPARRALTAGLGMGLLLTGCATGPAYVRPTIDTPAHYAESTSANAGAGAAVGTWLRSQPGDAAKRGPWWAVFDQPSLNALEARVDTGNQNIKQSVAQLRQARALVGTERSAYFPTVNANIDATQGHTSRNITGRSLAGKTVGDYNAGLSASWEPDLFDRVGHRVDAAQARYQTGAADLASVRLSMHTELALNYIDLRQIDQQTALLQRATADYARALSLVQTRFHGGIAPQSDVEQASANLEIAKAQLIDLGESRALHAHAMATLLGVTPAQFSLPPVDDTLPLPAVPTGLPSTLLERRPDVAAAERRVAAANANVGEATSAFFPQLLLSASGGFEASKLSQWVALPSKMWAIGPALVGTLFDGGLRRHNLAAAQASQDAAAAAYRQTALSAFAEVEDNLASLNVLAQESAAQQRAVDASQRAAQLALIRYRDGATDYLEVASTESTSLSQAVRSNLLATRQLEADVRLISALGGGWTAADEPGR